MQSPHSATIVVYTRVDGTTDVSIKVWTKPAPRIGARPDWSRIFKVVSSGLEGPRPWLQQVVRDLEQLL